MPTWIRDSYIAILGAQAERIFHFGEQLDRCPCCQSGKEEQEMMLLYHVPAGGELDGPFMA